VSSLLVASVFAGHVNDGFWLRLQREELARTTGAFDHAVFLNGADERLFDGSIVIGSNPEPRTFSEGHADALAEITRYCRAHSYDRFLILDSDAFPVRSGWIDILDAALERTGKGFAAPIRTENLDLFAHPSIFYTRSVEMIGFALRPATNLLGQEVVDLVAGTDSSRWFPLVKTNRVSPHPLLSAIYFDLFYHHGCGSRNFLMRGVRSGYYDHIVGGSAAPENLFDRLAADPRCFVESLLRT
jgi:hypothetical protein